VDIASYRREPTGNVFDPGVELRTSAYRPSSQTFAEIWDGPLITMRRRATAAFCGMLAAGLLGVGISSATPGPGEPGYCGAREDPLTCSSQTGPPTQGEAAFIDLIRGQVPGSDAQLLAIARGVCNMLGGGASTKYVGDQVAAHLGITNEAGGQVMIAAKDNACPDVPLVS
jgi:hypothetical protein